jgi:hypothetical protein
MLNNFFHEIMKKLVETKRPQMTSQSGAYDLHSGKARLHSRTSIHTPTRQSIDMHARTHRPISNTYCFSTATMIRERASMLRYTYIACLVSFVLGVRIPTKVRDFYSLRNVQIGHGALPAFSSVGTRVTFRGGGGGLIIIRS